MVWSTWTIIILYGLLSFIELYNLKDDDSESLIISTNTSHISKQESYSDINLRNFI